MPPRQFDAPVVATLPLEGGAFLLRLAGCQGLAESRAGQFVMLRSPAWGRDPLLPRALSILGVRPGGEAEFLVKPVGRATRQLARAVPGETLRVLGPLGTSFPDPAAGPPEGEAWLVAGGVGLAPLLFHAEAAARAGVAARLRLFYGGRSQRDLVLLDRIAASGVALELATEDGSRGAPGRVTDLVGAALAAPGSRGAPPVRLLACGPEPMLVAVARLARAHGVRALVSLEGEMACGIGVCLGCAVPAADGGFRCACKHGPVMDVDELGGRYRGEEQA